MNANAMSWLLALFFFLAKIAITELVLSPTPLFYTSCLCCLCQIKLLKTLNSSKKNSNINFIITYYENLVSF